MSTRGMNFRQLYTRYYGIESMECMDCNTIVCGLRGMMEHRCPEVATVTVYEGYCDWCGHPKRWMDERCDECGVDPKEMNKTTQKEQDDAPKSGETDSIHITPEIVSESDTAEWHTRPCDLGGEG